MKCGKETPPAVVFGPPNQPGSTRPWAETTKTQHHRVRCNCVRDFAHTWRLSFRDNRKLNCILKMEQSTL